MSLWSNQKLGFSLVEIVMALGLVSFCLVALLGLFSLGIKTSKQSAEETNLAAMSSEIITELRARTSSTTIALNQKYYFDNQGERTNAIGAYYECHLITQTDTSFSANLIRGTLTFTWPAHLAAGKRPNTNTFYSTFPHR